MISQRLLSANGCLGNYQNPDEPHSQLLGLNPQSCVQIYLVGTIQDFYLTLLLDSSSKLPNADFKHQLDNQFTIDYFRSIFRGTHINTKPALDGVIQFISPWIFWNALGKVRFAHTKCIILRVIKWEEGKIIWYVNQTQIKLWTERKLPAHQKSMTPSVNICRCCVI